MRIIHLILIFFSFNSYAVASTCDGTFEKHLGKKYPSMSKWNWSYSSKNTSLIGDHKEYDERLSIGAVEKQICVGTESCIVSDSICAVQESLRSMLGEVEDLNKPIRLRVVSYGVYFKIVEQMPDSPKVGTSCDQAYEKFYSALKDFWTEAFVDIGYKVTDIRPFEVKFDSKPEDLRSGECFHRLDSVKNKITSSKIPGDPYRLAWARIGFGVSWYGVDFFPAFDIEKIAE